MNGPYMNLDSLHWRLKQKLEWPIPYWLTPLGVFIISALYWLYSLAYDFTSPLLTHWVLDKIVYLGGIIGAALIAQHIFNENALAREKRERSLKAAFELTTYIGETGHLFAVAMNENLSVNDTWYQVAKSRLAQIKGYTDMYFEHLTPSVTSLNSKLDEAYRALGANSKGSIEVLKKVHQHNALIYGDRKTQKEYIDSNKSKLSSYIFNEGVIFVNELTELMKKVVEEHKNISSKKRI